MSQADGTKDTVDRRGLRLLLTSAAVSITGDGVLIAAAPLMAASLTRDPFQIGLVAAATYAAWIVAGIPAGALVDRWDRRRVMVLADVGRAAVLAVFAFLVFLGGASIPALIVTVFLVGVGSCFFDPSAQSVMPDLVGRQKEPLAKANGALWSIDNFGRSLSGPPIGAATFAVARWLPFGLDALSFLVSAVLVRMLPATPRATAEHPKLWASVRSGMRYLATHRELRRLTLGMGCYNFAWNLGFATMVLFAQDQLGLGAVGYGLLIASGAVGGVVAGWLTPKVATKVTATVAYGIALAAQAAVWAVIAASTNPWLAGA
ncbi:MFS transporter, partial [Rhizocola hellebori]|uniref:MFS transporter n=1 Tax=Rhizocola hellebori TaxID=1392758 RepID=UPI00194372BB